MFELETWEMLSYVVTVIGLPVAITVFVFKQRKERENEEDKVCHSLSDNYQEFIKIALANPDLHLFPDGKAVEPTPEQREGMGMTSEMLVSLFERA